MNNWRNPKLRIFLFKILEKRIFESCCTQHMALVFLHVLIGHYGCTIKIKAISDGTRWARSQIPNSDFRVMLKSNVTHPKGWEQPVKLCTALYRIHRCVTHTNCTQDLLMAWNHIIHTYIHINISRRRKVCIHYNWKARKLRGTKTMKLPIQLYLFFKVAEKNVEGNEIGRGMKELESYFNK